MKTLFANASRFSILGLLLLAFTVSTCAGSKGKLIAASPQLSNTVEVQYAEPQSGGTQGSQYSMPLAEVLKELKGLSAPASVDADIFGQIKSALARGLSVVNGFAPSLDTAVEEPPPYRIISKPPTGEANRVDDLTITTNDYTTFTLTWKYKNLGDYNLSGAVDLMDIFPIAENFGAEAPFQSEAISIIDGDRSGKIDIGDVFPLAENFFNRVIGYQVFGLFTPAPRFLADYYLIGEVPLASIEIDEESGMLVPLSFEIVSPSYPYLAVAPIDKVGGIGELSNVVTVPSSALPPDLLFSLVSPVNGAVSVSLAPTLEWTDAKDEQSYTLEVSADAEFTTTVYSESGIPANQTSLSLPFGYLLPEQTYFWRVSAVSGQYSALAENSPFSFTTGMQNEPPSSFNLLSPANGAINIGLNPTLSWEDASGETSYLVQLDDELSFNSPLIFEMAGIPANTTSLKLPDNQLQEGKSYYWRVFAVNEYGSTQAGNSPFMFTTASSIISLDPSTTYQTIVSWEATPWMLNDSPAFPNFRDVVFDMAVNELGLNRVRVEIRAGVENSRDYWQEYRDGLIDYQTWRSHRYTNVNDNSDPYSINWDGFHFSEIDWTIENIILPLKAFAEANGHPLLINVNYVAFTGQNASGTEYIHDDPAEYAEFVLVTYIHLRDKYGLIPDTWEVILEPDNVSQWQSGTTIGNAIVECAQRLEAEGFSPSFIAPSNTNMANAITYFDQMIAVPGVLDYLFEFSYHRYGGVSDANLQEIGNRSLTYGVGSAMLEHIGSGYEDLHKDLKIGLNTSWQQFTLAGAGSDDGGKYFLVDDSNPNNPIVSFASRTKFLRQYFKYVRPGALRIDASTSTAVIDPLAFINADGKFVVVVVVKTNDRTTFSVDDLPDGVYGISYTTASEFGVELTEEAVAGGNTVTVTIPSAGVLTIYQK